MRCWGTKRPPEIRCGKGLGYERATAVQVSRRSWRPRRVFPGRDFYYLNIAATSPRISKPQECDNCHAQMERLSKLPAMLTKRARGRFFVAASAKPLNQGSV